MCYSQWMESLLTRSDHSAVTPADARRNGLLSALRPDDLNHLLPHLRPIDLPIRRRLERAGDDIAELCFPTAGIVSIVAVGNRQRDQRIEAGIFGREGMSGTAVLLNADRSPHEVYVQMAGAGMMLPVEILQDAMAQRPALQALFLRYVHVSQVQTAFTVLANGSDTLQTRLARWILMAHDRIDGDTLDLTHEFLSLMLGVRRPGVTVAIRALEVQGAIAAQRGRITVVDREIAIRIADGSYGKAEAEYARLIGQPI